MATLSLLRTRIDTWLTARWPTITARQDLYFQNNGKYWQGLITHSIPPSHTTVQDNDIVPDNYNSKPTDQNESWKDVFPAFETIPFPCQLQCDVYSGPKGKGYVVTIRVIHNGNTYIRSQNVGPEDSYTKPWQLEEIILS